MTEKSLAAHRRNAKLSKGPATPDGRERISKANLRHGFYSQSQEAAARLLGEDPQEFRRLREGLRGKTTAAATLEEQIADRLARAFLLLNRADRMQEGYALQKAREEDCKREGRLHMQMMHLKMTAREWYFLSLSVARECYVTIPYDLDLMKQLHKEGMVKDMSEVALGLFYQLREPGTLGPGDPGFDDDEGIAQQRKVLFRIKQIFGLENGPDPDAKPARRPALPLPPASKVAGAAPAGAAPDSRPANAGVSATQPELETASQQADTTADGNPESPIPNSESRTPNPQPGVSNSEFRDAYPNITEEQWEAREPARQLLENLLTRQVEIFEAQHRDLMRQCVNGLTPYERAAQIAPTHPDAPFMQRMEDSNFRQITRLSHLLVRLRREERLGGARQDARESGKVKEKKRVNGDVAQGSRAERDKIRPIRKSQRKQRPLTMLNGVHSKNKSIESKGVNDAYGVKKRGDPKNAGISG
jgi:hypothetical protein